MPTDRMATPPDLRPLTLRLLAILVLAQVSFSTLAPILGPLRDGFGVSNQAIALLVAAGGLARLVFDLPAGSLVSRYDRRTLLLVGSVFAALGGFACALDLGFPFLVLARGLSGIGSAIVVAAALAQLTEITPSARRGVVLAGYEATFWLGSAVGSAASGVIATAVGWPWSFVLAGACGALAVVGSLVLPALGATRHGGATFFGGYREAFGAGGIRLAGTLAFILAVTFHRFGFTSTLAPLFAADIGLDPSQIGSAQAVASLLGVAAVLVGGYVGDRVGRPWVASAALALVGAATLSYLPVADFLGFLAVSAVMGLGGFGTSMGPALVADSLPAAHRARGIALFRLLTDLSQVTAPIAVGFLLDRSGSAPLIVGLALLPAVCSALLAAAFATAGRRPLARA